MSCLWTGLTLLWGAGWIVSIISIVTPQRGEEMFPSTLRERMGEVLLAGIWPLIFLAFAIWGLALAFRDVEDYDGW